MSGANKQFNTNKEFIADPTNHLLAVIDSHTDAIAAERDLAEAGFAEVHMYYGGKGAQTIDASGSEHGIGAQIVRSVQLLFSNKDNLAEYEDAANEGAAVLAIKAEDEAKRDAATAVLDRYHAHEVNYFGRAVVRTLRP